MEAASIIFAAGFGSRIKNFSGNKTTLPLKPGTNPFEGECPIILEIIRNLPRGPKALVVHHRKDEVIKITHDMDIFYCHQPVPDGTGGALIAARDFLEKTDQNNLIITMGDVPFVRETTYRKLIGRLGDQDLVILGFEPRDRAQYGALEIENNSVKKIHEWRYWKGYPLERQNGLKIFNSGIYAARRSVVIEYLDKLEQKPHEVEKERNGRTMVVKEYFITDLVELINNDRNEVGFVVAEDENEVRGIDTFEDLILAQGLFARMRNQQDLE